MDWLNDPEHLGRFLAAVHNIGDEESLELFNDWSWWIADWSEEFIADGDTVEEFVLFMENRK